MESKPDWESRDYAKSISAYVPIDFRFKADARASNLAKRFYILWAESSPSYSTVSFGVLGEIISQQNAVGKDKRSYCL